MSCGRLLVLAVWNEYLAFALTTEAPDICLSFLQFHSERLLVINFAISLLKRCIMKIFQWVLRNFWFIFKGLLFVLSHLQHAVKWHHPTEKCEKINKDHIILYHTHPSRTKWMFGATHSHPNLFFMEWCLKHKNLICLVTHYLCLFSVQEVLK